MFIYTETPSHKVVLVPCTLTGKLDYHAEVPGQGRAIAAVQVRMTDGETLWIAPADLRADDNGELIEGLTETIEKFAAAARART